MNEIPKDELEQLCERAAIETEHIKPDEQAQKVYEHRVRQAKAKWQEAQK